MNPKLLSQTLGALLLFSACESKITDRVSLIPQPNKVEILSGSLPINEIASVNLPASIFAMPDSALSLIRNGGLQHIAIDNANAVINFTENKSLAPNAYTLNIKNGKINIECSDYSGAFNAIKTLQQLIATAGNGVLPNLAISDSPRFQYRGLMLDCSRHFWTVDELKESIDQMSYFKLNKLHLHLTDNNAWRLYMEKYPELTEKGTFYANFPELSGKYYTKEDLKEVVRYAALRNVEVIPEVDMPGHNTALLAAMPNLSCNGGTFEAYPEEMALNQRRRGNENMICVGNPQSIAFVEDVIKELVDIFPSQYIHMGGDEVPTTIWESCPKCMALYKQQGFTKPGQIQDYFTKQVSDLTRKYGKTMVGWDEIDERGVATPEDMVMVWRNDGVEQQKHALSRNIPIIMAPQHGCYYDWGYAGNSTRKIYEWEPIDSTITADKHDLVKGVQACLWTERVATQDRVEWMLYPRITALAEVMWTEPGKKNWDSFYERINAYYPIMASLGINFYEDDALNETEFAPTNEKPALVRHANIETNIPQNFPYHPEYAFDGRTNSFYWGGTSVGKDHYFTILLGEPVNAKEIEVITGDSKDYITMADLLVSKDGTTYEKVGAFNDLGEAKAKLTGEAIKAVKIQITGQHTCWPIIKEIIIK